ncbi:MAG TPA: hypothetical protein VEM15_09055 [Thermodesulfobacteriota bacterium]|nr:hypothetical protein [Thermodesulfobacteriota bacterium]
MKESSDTEMGDTATRRKTETEKKSFSARLRIVGFWRGARMS